LLREVWLLNGLARGLFNIYSARLKLLQSGVWVQRCFVMSQVFDENFLRIFDQKTERNISLPLQTHALGSFIDRDTTHTEFPQ
jgi:hypothetical protein